MFCDCNKLSKKDVRRVIRKGASTPVEVYAALGCKGKCSGCEKKVRKLIKKEDD